MDIYRVAGFAVLTAVAAVTLKNYRPEIGMQVAAAGGIILLFIALAELSGFADTIRENLLRLGVDGDTAALVFKVIGIAYMSQTASEICADSGESALASKTELCGRIMIAAAALPTFLRLVNMLTGLIDEYL